jgi:predicted P-loop ATPase
MLCSKWVWEVEELGSTIRKADIEALKAFISKEIINVRKPYGHDEIVKPATASFIGTINSSGGFLADPTGSRRFRCCTLTEIDWKYSRDIDVNQIWAQAVALFKHGETFELDPETEKKIIAVNAQYEIDDPMAYDLFSAFNCVKEEKDKYTATAQIIYRLRTDGKLVGGNDNLIAQRISNILTRLGFEKDMIKVNRQPVRVWRGVWLKE